MSRLIKLRDEVQRNVDELSDHWLTQTVRPKTPRASFDVTRTAASVGVVIQGKIMTEHDFTLRTVEHYVRTFPGCHIFVSTWKNESLKVIHSLERAGANVLLNELPEIPGSCHLNYQIRSTLAGIQAVRDAGCKFALKTRTDTRMYAANIGDFLAGLVERFPVTPGYAARGRLAVLDYATRMFFPQLLSDLMVFGYTDDMLNYWNAPFSETPRSPAHPNCPSYASLLTAVIPEIYLCRNYLRRIEYPFAPTVTSWWQCLADMFIVVDRSMLEHFWPKYNFTVEHRAEPDLQLRNDALCGFRDWLGIMHFAKKPYFEVEDLLKQRTSDFLRHAA
jgi:hypothetical protein